MSSMTRHLIHFRIVESLFIKQFQNSEVEANSGYGRPLVRDSPYAVLTSKEKPEFSSTCFETSSAVDI